MGRVVSQFNLAGLIAFGLALGALGATALSQPPPDAPAKAKTEPEKNAPAAPPASEKRTQITEGDWQVACVEAADKRISCVLSQSLSETKSKKVVSSISIAKDTNDKLTSTLLVPSGVKLSSGAKVTIDGGSDFTAPFLTCLNVGCVATFEFTSTLAGQLAKAQQATVVVEDLNKRTIKIQFSAKGFAKAYSAFEAQIR